MSFKQYPQVCPLVDITSTSSLEEQVSGAPANMVTISSEDQVEQMLRKLGRVTRRDVLAKLRTMTAFKHKQPLREVITSEAKMKRMSSRKSCLCTMIGKS